jgi:Ca2+/Na+ antiporter
MALVIFQFVLSALVIIFAGSFLTKFADKVSETTTLVALATSLSELVSTLAAFEWELRIWPWEHATD